MQRATWIIMLLGLMAAGCTCRPPRAEEQRIAIDPIEIKPIYVRTDITIREADSATPETGDVAE